VNDVIEDGVYEEVGQELARVEAAPPTLFGTTDPAAVIVKATEAARPLAEVVRKQGLASTIQGREHVRVEGWTLLGAMLGVFPVTVWSKPLIKDGKPHGWEARVEARTRDGSIVGAAEAQCTRDENQWSFTPTGRNGQPQTARDDYALRSMAQTRATSKALRQPLGFVMQLAGFQPTPAEEMPADEPSTEPPVDADGATDWANVTVHFGTNTGKRVGDLTRRSREWYAGDGWAEKKGDSGRPVDDHDRMLRRACRVLSGMSTAESDGPFANDDEIPF
jgi:hypothetical protein